MSISDTARTLDARLLDLPPSVAARPVHLWNPATCGTIDIRIDRDGAWHHEGRPIPREGLVRLFASILRREADGSHVLVTPHEKLTITVEDAPFLAVDCVEDRRGEGPARLVFRTNLDEWVPLDDDHPLRAPTGPDGGFVPYLTVRPGLEARLTRSLAQELAGRLEPRGEGIGVVSGGQFFVIAGLEGADLR